MGKLQEFLMSNQDDIQATAEVAVSGFPVPFTIKSITEGENKAIRTPSVTPWRRPWDK